MILGWLIRDVDSRIADKQLMLSTPFLGGLSRRSTYLERGGGGQSSQGSEGRGGGVRTSGSGHTREFD